MDTVTSNINRSQKLVMMGRRDYQIKEFLSIPKYESTKGTSGAEKESLLQLTNNNETLFGRNDNANKPEQEVDNDKGTPYNIKSVQESESQQTSSDIPQNIKLPEKKEYVNLFDDDSFKEIQQTKQSSTKKGVIKTQYKSLRLLQAGRNEHNYSEDKLEEDISDAFSCSGSEYIPDTPEESGTDTNDEYEEHSLVKSTLPQLSESSPSYKNKAIGLLSNTNEAKVCKYLKFIK